MSSFPGSSSGSILDTSKQGSKNYVPTEIGKDLIFPSHKPITEKPIGEPHHETKVPIKKLVIRTLKDKPKLPDNFEEVTWAKLQGAIRAIHNYQPVNDSLEELYKACENLCLHKMADRLYSRLQEECESHLLKEKEKLDCDNSDDEAFLQVVDQCWQAHCKQMGLIRNIFLYLDRTYVLQTPGISSIWDMGIELFRKHIMSSSDVRQKTLNGLLSLIKRDRDGDEVNNSLLHSLIHMYIDLSVYYNRFETPFLQETRNYYYQEGHRLVSECPVPRYLGHVKSRLYMEGERVNNYLDKKTRSPLTKVVYEELIKKHVETILEKGFADMMEDDNDNDDKHLKELKLLYQLLSKVNALDLLRKYFGDYIKRTGTALVNDPSQEPAMVTELLYLKAKMDEIVSGAFQGDNAFNYMVKESFEMFINQRQNKPAELIAKYVDQTLRLGNKSMDDTDIEKTLNEVLVLFRYIQGKDIFEAFYKRDLAKRLLLNKSASFDYEKSMLSKLRKECGPAFTSKLEGMFKDIDLSKDFMQSFETSKSGELIKEYKIDLYVNVLTQGFWPSYPPSPLNIPPNVVQCQKIFRDFYLSKHNGRNLKWQNSLGHCMLAAEFPKGNKELVVSLSQGVVLLLFNDLPPGGRRTYDEIKEMSGMEPKELNRTLQSLACGKVRVLVKYPKGRDISMTDEFSVNEEFEAKIFRIKINTIQLKETKEENEMTTESVFMDRQHQIDAGLVRIAKMRKTLSHNDLITELLGILKFKPPMSDIKKRIESLIDREYLERDKSDSTKYKYLA
ncbi:Cullin family-domain-containing protein [Gigaspora rosea]|uniref:Cullin family-domain-containing protein n=1 Tax=Gigaspora rosea TaxID=44941 RepID=A0A397VPX5_9GLOM|nr:Cullin family-domain-containing protein [Gigaspora rosea]